MVAPTKLARFDVRVRAFLAEHFKSRQSSLAELIGLWETYVTRHLGVRIRTSVLEKDILPDIVIR
jgi:hypothetical protein